MFDAQGGSAGLPTGVLGLPCEHLEMKAAGLKHVSTALDPLATRPGLLLPLHMPGPSHASCASCPQFLNVARESKQPCECHSRQVVTCLCAQLGVRCTPQGKPCCKMHFLAVAQPGLANSKRRVPCFTPWKTKTISAPACRRHDWRVLRTSTEWGCPAFM